MFDRLLPHLLSGKFICSVTQPDAYRKLQDPAFAADVDDYLARINLKLATTDRGGAFYVDRMDLDAEARAAAGTLFKEVSKTFRPTLEFFRLVLRAGGKQDLLDVGTPLSVLQMLSAVSSSAALRPAFQDLVNRIGAGTAATDAARMERVFEVMRNYGYLDVANPEKGIYLATGKFQYLEMIVAYVAEHAQLRDEDPDAGQGDLL